jgi:cytoskeletal protein CcmA (bactofilin family)
MEGILMGFFKDFKDDLNETANELDEVGVSDEELEEDEEIMVNTLDTEPENDPELSQIAANLAATAEEKKTEPARVKAAEPTLSMDEDLDESDEIALITSGLVVTGNLDSNGSIDLLGTVKGNVSCKGKLTISGSVIGDSSAKEIFANNAKIEGNIDAIGSIKVGQGTVIVGNVSGTSAVIAGAIKGDIDVHGPVVVDSTAVIVGDIKSKTVQINNGAAIDGRCSQCYAEINTEDLFGFAKKK